MTIPFPNLTIPHLSAEYLSTVAARCTRGTLNAYDSDLSSFQRFLDGRAATVRAITKQDVLDYLASLANMTVASRARKLSVVRSFCQWLRKEGYVSHDPSINVRLSRKGLKDDGVVIPEREMRGIVERLEIGSRDRAVLELIALGLRPQEIADVQVKDLDLMAGVVTVAGRSVCLDGAEVALSRYLSKEQPEVLLVKNYAHRRLSRQAVWKIVQHATAGKYGPADFRRSRIVHLLGRGLDLEFVKAQTGFSKDTAIARYVKRKVAS